MSEITKRFLHHAADECQRVEIITRNGYHMYGKIVVFDEQSMLVNIGGVSQLVFLDAVSTIRPTEA